MKKTILSSLLIYILYDSRNPLLLNIFWIKLIYEFIFAFLLKIIWMEIIKNIYDLKWMMLYLRRGRECDVRGNNVAV